MSAPPPTGLATRDLARVTEGRSKHRFGGRSQAELPAELRSALDRSPAARARFDELPPSHRREYVAWVREARRSDTRERRAAQTVMRLLDTTVQ